VSPKDDEPAVDERLSMVHEAVESSERGEGLPIEEVWVEYGLTPQDGT